MADSNLTEVNDVTSSFEILIECVASYEDVLMQKITKLAKEKDISGIREVSTQAEQVKNFLLKIHDLKLEWTGLIFGESSEENSEGDHSDISATARTSWQIVEDKIRIETERLDGPPYSNVFPIALFKEIALFALNIIEKQGFVKTTNVLTLMSNQIISQSDYKKAPRLPIYATFKVLMKQNLFKNPEGNSHKYVLASDKTAIVTWVNSLS